MSRPENRRCKDCIHWDKLETYPKAQCRRNSPQVFAARSEDLWPVTGPMDWCGECETEHDTMDKALRGAFI